MHFHAFYLGGALANAGLEGIARSATADVTTFGASVKGFVVALVLLALTAMGAWALIASARNKD